MRTLLCLLAGLAAGCLSSGAKPMKPPLCATYAECETHDHQRVEVVGTYRIWAPRPGRSADDARSRQVRIALAGGEGGPFLEAGSDPRHQRAPEEIAKFRDKRVRVVGTFLRQMPQVKPPEMAQLGGSCITDVESIALDE
jgi:hypothetical protein